MSSSIFSAAPTHALAAHAFVCMEGAEAIILDLRSDQYLHLEGAELGRMTDYVQDWPSDGASASSLCHRSEDKPERMLTALERLGLVIPCQITAHRATRINLPAPDTELPLVTRSGSAKISKPILVIRCILSSIIASLRLRRLSLERIVALIADDRRRAGCIITNLPFIAELVATYFTVRPFLRSWKDACLLDSLSLVTLLSMYDVHPSWVFGVRAQPFLAHCWIQLGNVVLNDTVDNVRQFKPIMIA